MLLFRSLPALGKLYRHFVSEKGGEVGPGHSRRGASAFIEALGQMRIGCGSRILIFFSEWHVREEKEKRRRSEDKG